MRARFCLAEVGLPLPASADDEAVAARLDEFIAMIGICRADQQEVVRWSGLEFVEVKPGVPLCELMYQEGKLDFIRQRALQETLNKCSYWDGEEEHEDDGLVRVDGVVVHSPSVAWAHAEWSLGHSVACLRVGPYTDGPHRVERASQVREIHFLSSSEKSLPWLTFYREIPEVEDLPEDSYIRHSTLMFPSLYFKPNIHKEFRHFSDGYRSLRPEITRHLAALNDHFRSVLDEHTGEPDQTAREMQARCRVEMSPESPKTKQNRAAWEERKIILDGQDVYCEWHTKLSPDKNRIHFHPGKKTVANGKLVIGIFHEHLST